MSAAFSVHSSAAGRQTTAGWVGAHRLLVDMRSCWWSVRHAASVDESAKPM